jgi:hypothetical protein
LLLSGLFKADTNKDKKKDLKKNVDLLPPRIMVGDKGAYYPPINQDLDGTTWQVCIHMYYILMNKHVQIER